MIELDTNNKTRTYKDLKVWNRSILLSKNIFLITKSFPVSQQFGLKSQIEKTSVLVATNIAQGACKNNVVEFIKHLGMASGCLSELETQLVIANEVGFINKDQTEQLLDLINEIGRMILVLKNNLKKKYASNS